MKRNWRCAPEPYSLRGVVFDWTGTAVDYGCQAPPQAFVSALRRYGVESPSAK